MSLNVQYAIQIAQKAIDEKIDIEWWEEVRLGAPQGCDVANAVRVGPSPGRL